MKLLRLRIFRWPYLLLRCSEYRLFPCTSHLDSHDHPLPAQQSLHLPG